MKTETMHTPGPLLVERRSDDVYCVVTMRGTTIAKAFGLSDEANEANARLIAAAPELLEACQEAYQFVKDTVEKYPDIEFPPTLEESTDIIGRIRYALGKATGGEE